MLDFYVHESRQRTGCGKKLYEAMMEVCGVLSAKIIVISPLPGRRGQAIRGGYRQALFEVLEFFEETL